MGENLELVREAFEAFRRGGLEDTLVFADPNIECVRAPPLPDPQTYRGIDGVRQMYADWQDAYLTQEQAEAGPPS